MAAGRPRRPAKPRRSVTGLTELQQSLAAHSNSVAGIRKADKGYVRKRISQNPARVAGNPSLNRTGDELLGVVPPTTLGTGRRLRGVVASPDQLELFSGDELSEMTVAEVDRLWYFTPRTSNAVRPRAREAEYNADRQTLRVVFRSGGTYVYYGVPYQTAVALRKTSSFGMTLDRLVINRYDFEKVSA